MDDDDFFENSVVDQFIHPQLSHNGFSMGWVHECLLGHITHLSKPHSTAVGTWNTELLFSDPDMNGMLLNKSKSKLYYHSANKYIFSKEQTVPKNLKDLKY